MDPISEMLDQIKNGLKLRKDKIEVPSSNIKLSICEILKSKSLIRDCAKKEDSIVIKLNYNDQGQPKINDIIRLSKPSRRVYVSYLDIPNIRSGLGHTIVSTSKGIMEGREAKKLKIGGELICKVW